MPARWRADATGLDGGVTSGGAGGAVLAFVCRMVCRNSVFVNVDSSKKPDNQTSRAKSTQFRHFFRVWCENPNRNETRQPDKHKPCLSGFPSVCLVVGFSPDKVKTTQFRHFFACLSGWLVCLVVSISENTGKGRAGVYFCSAGRSQFDCPTASPPEKAPTPLRFAIREYS